MRRQIVPTLEIMYMTMSSASRKIRSMLLPQNFVILHKP